MSRPLATLVAIVALFVASACGGGTATVAPAAGTNPPAATASAATGGAACAPTADAGTVAAAMADTAFSPGQITAKVGDVVAWTNNDSATHTATLKDDPTCTTANLGQGETGALKFTAAGTYPFVCKIHASMTGTIEVTS